MSRTDKDAPYRVRAANGERVFYINDSNFRFQRRILKRLRSKAIRRYSPESKDNGAKSPYNGMRRTWDFE